MNKTLEYKGYKAIFAYNSEEKNYYGIVTNTLDVITFSSDTLEEIEKHFAESVEDYFEFCKERGEEPEPPRKNYSRK